MTNKLTTLDWVALILVIIGGINWGLVGVGFNLVNFIVGSWPTVESIVYILVGLSAIYIAVVSPKFIKG